MTSRKNYFELSPNYSSRQSFYGKARVEIFEDDSEVLISYVTPVACVYKDGDEKKAVVFDHYSMTTTSHIKEFLSQHGFYADKWNQIWKDYGLDKAEEEGFNLKDFKLERGFH